MVFMFGPVYRIYGKTDTLLVLSEHRAEVPSLTSVEIHFINVMKLVVKLYIY
eukprot:SAG31_NODE_3619_length_4063_cov_1.796670_2_plen_52_part_00